MSYVELVAMAGKEVWKACWSSIDDSASDRSIELIIVRRTCESKRRDNFPAMRSNSLLKLFSKVSGAVFRESIIIHRWVNEFLG